MSPWPVGARMVKECSDMIIDLETNIEIRAIGGDTLENMREQSLRYGVSKRNTLAVRCAALSRELKS